MTLGGRGDFVASTMTRAEFDAFCAFVYDRIGVRFTAVNRAFVDQRIVLRARANHARTFREYFTLLRSDASGTELQALVNLLTTNETYFFRERDQIEALVRFVLPEIAARKEPGATIRIWSLPCSTGEEPYSIAIAVLEAWPDADRYRIEIMASDIDTRALAAAAAGRYNERSLQRVDRALRARYFRPFSGSGGYTHEIISELRDSIDFFHVNVNDKLAMARQRDIDVVFCRNMLIYFDDLSRREAIAAIFESLTAGGYVFLGHAENMSRMSSLFLPRRVGDLTIYVRPESGSG